MKAFSRSPRACYRAATCRWTPPRGHPWSGSTTGPPVNPGSASAARPFRRLHKFELHQLIGEGAMGVVWKAYDPVLRRYVAVKLLHPQVGKTRQARDRFLAEARAAAALQHPSIITVYDLGEADGQLFIAMELVEGEDLSQLVASREPLALERKLDIAIALLEGLQYAHQRGVIHRDIKPSNLRVTADGRLKIMDFGIARLQSADVTDQAAIVGTPNYMAPEQITNGAITPATDVFAAGAVLYELLAYQRPFEGESLHGVLYKVLTTEAPPLRTLAPSIPAALERVVAKAMNKVPEERYEHAGKMLHQLVGIRAALADADHTTARLEHDWKGLPLPLLRLISHAPLRWRLAVLAALALVVGSLAYVSLIPLSPEPPPRPVVEIGPPATPPTAVEVEAVPAARKPAALVLAPALAALRDAARRERQTAESLGAGINAVSSWLVAEALIGAADSAARAQSYSAASSGWREAAAAYRRSRGQADSLRQESALALRRAAPVASALAQGPRGVDAAAALGRAESLHLARSYSLAVLAVQQVEGIGLAEGVAPPSRQPPEARQAIDVLLRDLQRAVASKKVGNLRQLSPGMTEADAAAWEVLFARPERVTVTYRVRELRLTGQRATASVETLYRFTPPEGGLAREERRRQEMELVRTTAGWRLRRVHDLPG